LKNVGGSATANLAATLLTINGVIGPSAPQIYGQLAPGGPPVTAPFTFNADGACGGSVTAVWQLQDGATNLGNVNFNFQLGQLIQTAPLAQSFDNGIPNSWSNTTSIAQDFWSATNDGAVGTVAYVGDAGDTNEADLISPPIIIGGLAPQLIFQHRYNLESPGGGIAYDGGVLEIKIGGSAFTDILAAGGTFASNGYNASIIAEGGNPLSSQLAWSGNSGNYVTTVVNLPASAIGQTVQFAWVCATDVTNEAIDLSGPAGWWIRDVTVTEQSANCCASAPFTSATILSPANGAQFTSASNIISGSATPGDVIAVSDNSMSTVTLAVDTNGFFQGPIALVYGTNVLTVQQQPVNPGGASVSVVLTPGAPMLSVPAISGAPVVLTGEAVADASVAIFDNGSATPVTGLTTGADGIFSGDAALSLGLHSLTAAATINGTTGPISAPAVVDVVNFSTPAIIFPTNGFVTDNPLLTIRATGTNGAAISIYDNGGKIGAGVVNKNGRFAFAGKFTNGAHALTVSQTAHGVVSGASPPVDVTVQLRPVILAQPQSQSGFVGGGVIFSAAAYGAPPLNYSWQRNGAAIAGAARPTLTLSPLNANSAATYQLLVRNAYGSAASDAAVLTLVPNPFPPLAGAYSGLFMEDPAQFQSSGLLGLTLTPLGRFTGKITGGGAYNFSGGFSPEGQGQVTVLRGPKVSPLTLSLTLGLTNNPAQIFGTVSDGVWTASLRANRAVFSAAQPFPEPGNDTAIFGAGYGSVAVGLNGYAALHGFLSDNSALASAAISVSADGQWPLYIPLYGNAGALFGWLGFTNSGATNLSGALVWARANSFNSFNRLLPAVGTPLVAQSPFLGLTNLQITLTGGDLPGPLTNSLTLLQSGVLKPQDAAIPGLSLSVNTTNGLVTGHFTHPSTHAVEQIKGIIFQAQTNASGFFRDANGSGSFLISPAAH
jgi:hypothetical protein